LALTLAWLAMLRTPVVAHLPAWASWTMVLVTIAITVPVQYALRRRLRLVPESRLALGDRPAAEVAARALPLPLPD
jgi:hypothetical protein